MHLQKWDFLTQISDQINIQGIQFILLWYTKKRVTSSLQKNCPSKENRSILPWIRHPFSRAPQVLASTGNAADFMMSYAPLMSPARLKRSTMHAKCSELGSTPNLCIM